MVWPFGILRPFTVVVWCIFPHILAFLPRKKYGNPGSKGEKLPNLVPNLPNTSFPILHIFVRFSHKYVHFLQICEKLILPNLSQYL
jgi:hypothetical protein